MKQKIDEQLRMLEYNLGMLENVRKNGQENEVVMADETISKIMVIIKFLGEEIERNLSKTKALNYMKYVEGDPVEDVVETLCGNVESAEGKVESDSHWTIELKSSCILRSHLRPTICICA